MASLKTNWFWVKYNSYPKHLNLPSVSCDRRLNPSIIKNLLSQRLYHSQRCFYRLIVFSKYYFGMRWSEYYAFAFIKYHCWYLPPYFLLETPYFSLETTLKINPFQVLCSTWMMSVNYLVFSSQEPYILLSVEFFIRSDYGFCGDENFGIAARRIWTDGISCRIRFINNRMHVWRISLSLKSSLWLHKN